LLSCDDWLGWDDRLSELKATDSLERSSDDGDVLGDDGGDATDAGDDASLLGIELPLWMDGSDKLGALDILELGAEERPDSERDIWDDWSLALGEPLLELLLDEPLDFVDERLDGLRESDGPDRLESTLLRLGRLAELFEDLSEEPLERDRLLELPCGLLLGLLFDELSTELETLLSDDSLNELGDDRDDSLTLENDLLDP
jgi:hypothetical protein